MKTTEPIDPRDQFDQWCDLWDQAQEDGVFPETETPPTAANQIPDYDYGLDEPESEPPLSQDDFESGTRIKTLIGTTSTVRKFKNSCFTSNLSNIPLTQFTLTASGKTKKSLCLFG